ncbi:hypothetical protein BGW80DRAFT_1259777 [Lactifluus volemus]|nr:hypothetical protein BGW80DRAFT_1259777 [Lactifluus volemus]
MQPPVVEACCAGGAELGATGTTCCCIVVACAADVVAAGVATMVDMGAGVGSVGALLVHKTDDARSVSRGIAILETMVQRGGNMCHDAVQTLCRLVSALRGLEPLTKQEQEEEDNEGEEEGREWEWAKLLPARLFSADPGLLSLDTRAPLSASASESLLTWFMEKEPEIVWETDTPHDARTQWAMLCAEVIMRSAPSPSSSSSTPLLRMFWGGASSRRRTWDWPADVRALVWRTFAERWRALAKGWEEAPVLLSVPFADKDGWEMSTEDLDVWDAMLQSCLEYVLDEGADAARVLDHVAGTIASTHIPTGASATRAADILLGHLEVSLSPQPHDAAPALLLAFVNDTLVSTYPPEPQDKVVSMWLLRAVKKVVGALPARMLREAVSELVGSTELCCTIECRPLATTMLTLAFVMTKGGQAITSILVVYPDLYAVPPFPHLDPNQSQSERGHDRPWPTEQHTPTFATLLSDLSTLALLVFPVWRAHTVEFSSV